jgi:plasmid maintenance system killer protein
MMLYKNKKVQRQCDNPSVAMPGEKRAKKLKQRLSQLRAARTLESVGRLPPARCHELTGDLAGLLSVDLDHPYRLLFEPANEPIPRRWWFRLVTGDGRKNYWDTRYS